MLSLLLTRDEFRLAVFTRDKNKCAFCDLPAVDAHHIIERRLFPDGGYYVANGASVCQAHHILCEQTLISVEDVRSTCGIVKPVIPPHLYDDQEYDKWGNPVLANGMRLKGDLFFDESVQKVLKEGGVLHLFSDLVKYPRTHHLPWSESLNKDDRLIETLEYFQNKRVIATEKMDGENTTLYTDYFHARSVDGRHHESRNWVKNFWGQFKHDIPKGWRICGENLFAKHSIYYKELPSFFLGFSIWNEKNICLSWDETLEWFGLLGIQPVPILFDGQFDEGTIRKIWNPNKWETNEGYVIRVAEPIYYGDFRKKFAKFVRKNHIQTTKHWMFGQRIETNGMVE